MIPNLIGAMCAITWHIYDNQENLYGLVSLQGIFTFIGNSTLALAAIIIFKEKFQLFHFIGATFIISGIYLSNRKTQ